jgi:ribonucleotide monophosphatase NagD (HAD superfamily)
MNGVAKRAAFTTLSSYAHNLCQPSQTATRPKMARIGFAFDIDGVLIRGKTPVPGAREALLLLHKLGIPFIFLTNGGGRTEAEHVNLLADRLSLPLHEEQFIQSHTPFHDLVELYKEKTVLAIGGHGQSVRELAQAYGFEHVVISSDLLHEFPHIHPFPEMTHEHHKQHGRKPRRPSAIGSASKIVNDVSNLLSNNMETGTERIVSSNGTLNSDETSTSSCSSDSAKDSEHEHGNGWDHCESKNVGLEKDDENSNSARYTLVRPTFDRTTTAIEDEIKPNKSIEVAAILVWTSPRDWCLDLQLIVDLLLSNKGSFGSYSPLNGTPGLPNNGYQQDCQPKLYFANPDLAWATPHHLPRLAQGAFRAALEGIWAQLTDGKADLLATKFGKPTREMYRYGEKALLAWSDKIAASRIDDGDAAGMQSSMPKLDKVYMVGDNPASDICGANRYVSAAGIPWRSILVESGVYKRGTRTVYEPHHIARDVNEAVHWVLKQEGIAIRSLDGEV